jgi:2-polyprenyl-3-methyl-5-hydroxy-6-metoxy-1,4-benzoquinol methylase
MNLVKTVRAMWSQDPLAMASFMRDLPSFVRLHFLYAAVQSGLLESLRTPMSREDLLENLEVERSELLDALLDLGLATGELKQEKGLFQLKGRRARALVGKKGSMYAGFIEAQVTYYNSVYRHSPDRMRGEPLGNYLDEIGEIVAQYSELEMPYVSGFVQDQVVGRGSMRILDIGCGTGNYLRVAAEANPEINGIGLELDEKVAEQARHNLVDWGLDDKIMVMVGNFKDPSLDLEGEFDLIGLYNVIYYFEPEERPLLFQRVRTMLSDCGILLLITNVQMGGKDLFSANLNLATSSMVGCTPLPTLNDLSDQLTCSGFEFVTQKRLIPTSAIYGIIAR